MKHTYTVNFFLGGGAWIRNICFYWEIRIIWFFFHEKRKKKNAFYRARGHPRGRFGRKSLPKLADFSLSWAEGEVKMYRIYREILNLDQNFSLKSWNCRKTSPSLKGLGWPLIAICKAPISLGCDCLRQLETYIREWVLKQSWNSHSDSKFPCLCRKESQTVAKILNMFKNFMWQNSSPNSCKVIAGVSNPSWTCCGPFAI